MENQNKLKIIITSSQDNEFAHLFSLIRNEDLKRCILFILKYVLELERK